MIHQLLNQCLRVEAFLKAGGPVMIPLVMISVVMWTLIIRKGLFLRRLLRNDMSHDLAGQFMIEGKIPDRQRFKGLVAELVSEFLFRRSGSPKLDKYILDETVVYLTSTLDRHMSLISVLSSIAPLLGLLGTVVGMIATFDVISVFGTGNARAMAGGISEALITTQMGLLVAIPGLTLNNFLKKRVGNLKVHIASVGIYLKRYV